VLISLLNLHNYLINRGLFSSESIVSEHYVASYFQYRSNIFIVKNQNDNGLVLKQPQFQDEPAYFLIQKEATCLWKIFNEEELNVLRPIVPEYLGFDATSNVLATGLVSNTMNFQNSNGTASELINDEVIAAIVNTLSIIHMSKDGILKNPSSFFLPKTKPWVFSIAHKQEDGEFYLQQYVPVIRLIIQDTYLLKIIDEANEIWNIESLIHGDIKWSNILIEKDKNVKLIDWEMTDFGDLLWDIAGLISGFITDEILNSSKPYAHVLSIENNLILRKTSFVISKYMTFSQGQVMTSEHIHKIVTFVTMRLLQSSCEHNDYQLNLLPIAHSLIINASEMAKIKGDIVDQLLILLNEQES